MTSQEHAVTDPKAQRHTYPQIILFGDSITQQCELTFGAALRRDYARKADVVNRGFSGYTSRLALDVLPRFFPSSAHARVRVMTLFFGANDACLPGNAQHVDLEEYVACLRAIVRHELVQRQATKVILIVPAPVDEYQLEKKERSAANTKRYADACRQVGKELGLPIVDLWAVFMKRAGWEEWGLLIGSRDCGKSQVLDELLSDGLHFTATAYSVLLEELKRVMQDELAEETADHLPMVFPAWSDLLVGDKTAC